MSTAAPPPGARAPVGEGRAAPVGGEHASDRAPLRTVTAEEVAAFERDGYVVVRGVLDPAWLAPLDGACERILAMPDTLDITAEAVRLAPTSEAALFGAPPYADTLARRGHFRVHFNSARSEPAVLDFALRGAVGGVAAMLMRSATARFVDDVMFVKDPGAEEATEWHDDDGGGVMVGAQKCSLWVSLADVTPDAGPLAFLRASHRRHLGWRQRGEKADALVAAHSDDIVTCPVRVGDVIAHHPATIHGSPGNGSSVRRRSWALRFAGEGMRFALPVVRENERAWWGLEDGAPLAGRRFPLAWPPQVDP